MDSTKHQQRSNERNQNLDPRLWDTEGTLLPQTGAQFGDGSMFDAPYVSRDANQDMIMDLGSDVTWPVYDVPLSNDDQMTLRDQMQGSAFYTPDAGGSNHSYHHNMTPQSQSQYQLDESWPPSTPQPSHLWQQTLATPPNSSSPHSLPQGDHPLPQIAFQHFQQQQQQPPPNLSLDTNQPPMMLSRNTLSPYDAYRTPISVTSTQQNQYDEPSTPTRQKPTQRGRARSAAGIGYGMEHLMTEQFLQQSESRLDVQQWADQNPNGTNQLREVQTTPQPRPTQMVHRLPRSAPPSIMGHTCSHESCDKDFATKQDLQHHERYHKEGTNICDKCKKTFMFPKDLNRHLLSKIHNMTGGGQYKCDVVDCKFFNQGWARRDHWKRHMERVHGYIIPARSRQGSEAGR